MQADKVAMSHVFSFLFVGIAFTQVYSDPDPGYSRGQGFVNKFEKFAELPDTRHVVN